MLHIQCLHKNNAFIFLLSTAQEFYISPTPNRYDLAFEIT
jgi:hypothetical protein